MVQAGRGLSYDRRSLRAPFYFQAIFPIGTVTVLTLKEDGFRRKERRRSDKREGSGSGV